MAVDIAALNALTSQYGANLADLDDTQNRTKINYNNAIAQLKQQNTKNQGKIAVNASDRGMAQSGIRGQSEISNMQEYNQARALEAQKQQLALSTLARKRLEADQAYNTQAPLLQIQVPGEINYGGPQ